MSDAKVGRPPIDEAQWGRQTSRRLRKLENKPTARVGSWVLIEIDGELHAVTPGRDPIPLTIPVAAAAATDAGVIRRVRTVTILGAPTGGIWALAFRDLRTPDLDWDASQTEVLNALLGLSVEFTALDFLVAGALGGPYVVATPDGTLRADSPQLTGGSGVSIDIT